MRWVPLNRESCHFVIHFQEYEEVIIPPAKPIPHKAEERLMPVSELEELVKGCFMVILEKKSSSLAQKLI
jgi:hypothetical protein